MISVAKKPWPVKEKERGLNAAARIEGPEISWQLAVSLYVNSYSLFGKFAPLSRRNDSYDFNAFDDLTGSQIDQRSASKRLKFCV